MQSLDDLEAEMKRMPNTKIEKLTHWSNDRKYFFKYATGLTAKIILENRTLRWSTPGKLNDPYDTQFDLGVEFDSEIVKAAALQKLWDAHYGDEDVPVGNKLGAAIKLLRGKFPQLSREDFNREFGATTEKSLALMRHDLPTLQKGLREFMADSKILCLTELPDNMLMWTHYADEHRGVVLRFKSVPELDSPWGAARPIEYRADMPQLVDNDFLADMLSGRISMDPKAIMFRMIYTKSKDWEYEREWRIFSGSGRDKKALYEDLQFGALELDALIVGSRMPDNDRQAFSELIRQRYPHAELLKVEKAEKKFKLEIKPLDK